MYINIAITHFRNTKIAWVKSIHCPNNISWSRIDKDAHPSIYGIFAAGYRAASISRTSLKHWSVTKMCSTSRTNYEEADYINSTQQTRKQILKNIQEKILCI